MKKFILMSVLLATMWIPIVAAAKYPNARLGARKVQKQFLVFMFLYVITVLYISPRL